MRMGVGRAVSRKKPGSLIALPSNPRGTAFGLTHEKETNFSLVYVSVICLLLFGVRVRVSFMGVHLVWWPRVPHVEGPHTWFTICCRHLGILTSICTRSSVFSLWTGPPESCRWFCLQLDLIPNDTVCDSDAHTLLTSWTAILWVIYFQDQPFVPEVWETWVIFASWCPLAFLLEGQQISFKFKSLVVGGVTLPQLQGWAFEVGPRQSMLSIPWS